MNAPPVVHEVNTLVWLNDVKRRLGGDGAYLDLRDLPKEAWDELAVPGADVVWLMGVWERSPAGRSIALTDPGLLDSFRTALPDLADDDIAGSPYCVRRYVADERLGGRDGLAVARAELDRRGLGLYLDYVPNHVAPDHPWLPDHPDYFVRGDQADHDRDPAAYIALGGHVYARGRDPFFPPWPDVVQLNAFAPQLRAATAEVLSDIGDQCDGVRCDMAMLMMNDVFARTWGTRAGTPPPDDFWPAVLTEVRGRHPHMTFMAEAYWDLEFQLQGQGFDFCYDKRLYDRLAAGEPGAVRDHLRADLDYQRRLVRFLENHDEPRAAATFGQEQERAAAVVVATLPGAPLWHEGQLDGRRVRVPVFLGRRPDEPPDVDLRTYHTRLLAAVRDSGMRTGDWRLLETTGWPDNRSNLGVLAWTWATGRSRHLVVVNFTAAPAQARVPLPWGDLGGRTWRLRSLMTDVTYDRAGDELMEPGLYVALDEWAADIFAVGPAEP
ncbi:hypothetical protein ACGFNU_30375 [Spirillospora sp. NPDC048911]|uniref:hypothetical protein n=1 Tax=Spirillospora sp. NPDC048911 TaxID=3364527 RepID=UPI00371A655F